MTDEELIEQVARAVHEHLCRRDVMQYLDNDEDCAGIARAILPIIKAERIRGGEMVKEAAVRDADEHARLAWKIGELEGQSSICSSGRNYGARAVGQAIRALSVPAIVEAGDGDL